MSFLDHIKDPRFYDGATARHLGLLLFAMYIFIFCMIDHIEPLRPVNEACLVRCPRCKHNLTALRGKDYYIHATGTDVTECAFTTWELSHVLLHVYIGYYYNIRVSLAIGILFEIYEYVHFNCGSWLDLMWNTIGFMIGAYLRYRRQTM